MTHDFFPHSTNKLVILLMLNLVNWYKMRQFSSGFPMWIMPITLVFIYLYLFCFVFVVVVLSMNILASRFISWSLVLDPELWHILFVTGEGRTGDSHGRLKRWEWKWGEWSYVKFEFALFSTKLKMFEGFYDKIRHALSSCAASWNFSQLPKQVDDLILGTLRSNNADVTEADQK